MKAIVLAAGYGTRLQSLIGDMPKALVKVGDHLVLDYLMHELNQIVSPADTVIVSNARYLEQFASWQQARSSAVTVLSNGSLTAETRLGAVRDMQYAIDCCALSDDLLILAADNILMFGLEDMLCPPVSGIRIGIRANPDMEDQKRRGVVDIDSTGMVKAFAEKPAVPASAWAAAPLYLVPARFVHVIDEFLNAGGNPDSPGYLIEYLVGRYPVHGWILPGEILDIGNPESLRIAIERLAT